ncbi:hypothetical protein MMA231_00939 [Asticcacaulis sp. MM231]|uniref:hypothetical protein n=1 Tax=Asticcacaulis sp. MM231 TaxID=3157666 RepID=UPI0032D58502
MGKRKPAFHPDQGDFFAFELPSPTPPADREGALAGIDKRVASAVALMILQSGLGRHEVAINVSEVLDDTVTKAMLDAYASEAREGHNISAGRLLALTAVTGGYGILNGLLREIGATVLVGQEILTAQLGHKERQMKILAEEIAVLKRSAPLITKGRR